MGGYGHSRLREFILGGVTRGILGLDDGAGAAFALSRYPGPSHCSCLDCCLEPRFRARRCQERYRLLAAIRIPFKLRTA